MDTRRRFLALCSSATVIVGCLAGVVAPATASSGGIDDAAALIERIAPTLLDETVPAWAEPTSRNVDQGLVRPTDEELSVAIPISSFGGGDVVRIRPVGATSVLSSSDIVVLASEDPGINNYIQPHDGGVRFLSAIDSDATMASVSYEMDFPGDVRVDQLLDGTMVFLPVDSDSEDVVQAYGAIRAPWALDAAGRSLPTHFDWASGVLTQIVETDDATQYPVLADPDWGYELYISAGIQRTGGQAFNELSRCFNCSFPVGGAPAVFPNVGSMIGLNASPISWVAVPAPVRVANKYNAGTVAGFGFDALAGHFDGEGSFVQFTFTQNQSGSLVLQVMANVKNDLGPGNAANTALASAKWHEFASNLRAKLQ
ncbi:hypothetical protein KXS11_11775 [Plantibacter flavus]|uniref:hypothetical protein n=1 Tax=Plantibacter flavus TaxID=150123 RepID=UPI003F1515AA